MDQRRLSTGDVLASGILSKRPPETDIPEDRERASIEDDNWNYVGDEAIAAAIEAGKLVSSANYYGIPYAWKSGDGVYCGRLLQYRSITETRTFATAVEAAEWFGETHRATDG